MKKVLLLALLTFSVATFVQAQGKEKVAVYVSGNIGDRDKKIIGSKAVSRISRSKRYAAVEHTEAFADALTEKQNRPSSGEVRDDRIAALGKRFGVRYVAVFEASKAYDLCFVSARLIDVESGSAIKSAGISHEVQSSEDWIAMTNNVAFRLVSAKAK